MSNVIEMQDQRRRIAQEAWTRINTQSKRLREDWLVVGEYLIDLRKQYPADQDYGREARKVFRDMGRDERGAAVWGAELALRHREFCAEMWPNINNPRALRNLFLAEQGEEEDDIEEPLQDLEIEVAAVSHHATPTEVEHSAPENVEIAEPEPEIQEETASEKDEEDREQGSNRKSPLHDYLTAKEIETLHRFYPKSRTMGSRMAIRILKKMADAKQVKTVRELIKVIDAKFKDKTNQVNTDGDYKPVLNARMIHFELPIKFANAWEFVPEKPGKIFMKMLNDAEELYQVGEAIKHIPRTNMPQREVESAKVWNALHRAPIPSANSDHGENDQPTEPAEIAPPRREDQIKICGVSFWPQTENQPKAPYHVVWGAAHIADEVYREFHLACKMPIADAIMAAKQLCRALRLFNKEGGQLTLAMLTAMANQKELLNDPAKTSWPTKSGTPPAFDA